MPAQQAVETRPPTVCINITCNSFCTPLRALDYGFKKSVCAEKGCLCMVGKNKPDCISSFSHLIEIVLSDFWGVL